MKVFFRIVDGISVGFMWISVVMTWAMVLIVFSGVVARYFFNSPINWIPEFSQFLFGASFMLGGAYVLKINGHVRIDILVRRIGRKARAFLECVNSSAFWLFSMVLLFKGAEMAMTSLRNMETSGTYWDPPVYPIKMVIPLAAALIMIQGLGKLIADFTTIFKGD
ncbi:TRAP transporter small permease subunit [Desulfatitalea tepidiphila]|uniref:TRAP transporter small permease subunit n=1 Tax=Desulfatitalea tepidiphila TaxID=1185843 RepID=UPI0006B5252C|nr:TRAP transporter small permease subunit [Desulfatitalea tepidiphila]